MENSGSGRGWEEVAEGEWSQLFRERRNTKT